jgi:hypothetical protein
MKSLLTILSAILVLSLSAQQTKKEKDIASIKSMEGCFKVTFNFAETFSPDTAYEYYDRYSSAAIEYVKVIEEEENHISLQHLLVISDSMVIKHWRQDWVYEESSILSYNKDQKWKTIDYSPEEVTGTWTQKVFQVDDSPRYESKGTWMHVDGKHYWEGVGYAPLPRREYTKRSDYNVVKRHSRVELSDNGWFIEQDNEKLLREESGDMLVCMEKGIEVFTKGDYNCQPAIDWWNEQHDYWKEVRAVWNDVFQDNPEFEMTGKVENKMLWQRLYEYGDEVAECKTKPSKIQKQVREIIDLYLKS